MRRFDEELARLNRRVSDMGDLAETMVSKSCRALIDRVPALMEEVRAAEPRLDQCQIEVDAEAIRLITVYSPIARDLRVLLMITRINSELERIGDQAVDNCEYTKLLETSATLPPLDSVRDMSSMALRMLHDALEAFRHADVGQAQTVIALDDRMDAMNAAAFRDFLERASVNAATVTPSMGLILVARSLERIADHATNICEEVFYAVSAHDIRHGA